MASVLLVFMLVVRAFYTLHSGVGSDEPQHLHVVWGWANGYLQYRDVFDNHTPLFHMVCAPLFYMLGERADIIVWMRMAMIPFYIVSLWCVYKITASLFSSRAGVWAAIFTGLSLNFMSMMTQFRTDDLWVMMWLLTLLSITTGPFTKKRAFVFGLLLGTTFAVSMKTSLLLISLLLGTVAALIMARRHGTVYNGWAMVERSVAALLGTIMVPGFLVAFFAAHGALGNLYYCVIEHNALPGVGNWRHFSTRRLLFPLALPFMLWPAGRMLRTNRNPHRGMLRAIVLLTALFYITLLQSYWPLITHQDYPVFYAMIAGSITALVLVVSERLTQLRPWLRPAIWMIPAAIAVFELLHLTRSRHLFSIDGTKQATDRLALVIRLTDPTDYVMDGKGSTIFRKRPFYYAIESLTRARIHLGLVKNDIVECLIATRTGLVSTERAMGAERGFVDSNYIPAGFNLQVAGQFLSPVKDTSRYEFEVGVPMRYSIVTREGGVSGILDGKPYSGSAELGLGAHVFEAAQAQDRLALVWSQAIERGLKPFDIGQMTSWKK